ncbi:ABC transporter substrate-binding protein [Undibacterium arcticum]
MLAVGPTIFNAKTYYISTNAGPSQYAGEQCNPYFFNVAWQNDSLHEAVGKQVNDKGFKNVVLVAPNYPAGKDALAGFKRYYKGKVADEIYTKLGQLDYGTELAQIRSMKPDAVLHFSCRAAWGSILSSNSSMPGCQKKRPTFFGPGFSADEDIIKAVGAPMLGMFNASQWGGMTSITRKTNALWRISLRNTAGCHRCTPPRV